MYTAARTAVALLALASLGACARSVGEGDGGGVGCIHLVAAFVGDVVESDAAPRGVWHVAATAPDAATISTCSTLDTAPYALGFCGPAAPGWRGQAWLDLDPTQPLSCNTLAPGPTSPVGTVTFALQPGMNPDLAIEIRRP